MKFSINIFEKIPTKFTMTYLLLLFISLGLSFFIVNTPVQKIKNNILINDLAFLKDKSNVIDEKLGNVEKTAYQISNNTFINQIISEDSGSRFYLDLNDSRDQLFNYRNKLDEDFVYDYFVYYGNSNYVITPYTCYNADFFNSNIIKPGNNRGDLTSFFHLIGDKHTKVITKNMSFSYQGNTINSICYIMPIPLIKHPDEVENLCMIIKESYFNQTFSQKDFSSSGYLKIYNENNEPLISLNYSDEKDLLPNINLSDIDKDCAVNKNINGLNLTIVSYVSKQNNWRYIWVQPQAVAMNDLFSMRYNIILLFAVTFIIGSILAIVLARYNSRPILHIAKSLNQTNTASYKSFDTFKEISDSLNALINDNHYFEKKIAEQKPLLQNVIAGQLLSGSYGNFENVYNTCDYLEFSLKSSLFLVCSLRFLVEEDVDNLASENITKINSAKTCFKELIHKALSNHVLYNESSFTDLSLITSFDDLNQLEQFYEMLSKISQELLKNYGMMIVIGISKPNTSSNNLPKSYQEAQESLNYVQFIKNQRIIKYSDIPIRKLDYYYPIELEQRLINVINLGNLDNLNEIIDTIIIENFEKRQLTNYSTKHLYNDILSTCIYLKNKIPAEINLDENLKVVDYKFVKHNNFEQIFSALRIFCSSVINLKSDRNKIFIQKILEYIDENYWDQNLCLTSVAEKFNISAGYLSTFFKKQTGKNFTDSIESIRITAACKLLKDSNITINDISAKVGFSNVKSFRRSFERIMATSPKVARQEFLNSHVRSK